MKFITDGRDFKQAVEKVLFVTKNRALMVKYIVIETGNCCAIISAHNLEQCAVIEIPATVLEPGSVMVSMDTVTRIINLDGDITVSSEMNTISAQNKKKIRTIPIGFEAKDLVEYGYDNSE